MEEENCSIRNTTRTSPPQSGLLCRMKEEILGKNYDLSLVWIGSTRSQKINSERRGKEKPANVLAFPLSKISGEIFIDLAQAKKDAKKWSESEQEFVLRLFIHALLHLKGFAHSGTMESEEDRFLHYAKKNSHRYRN